MSTRSNIIVNFKDYVWSQFYHHSDGYPEGVGKMLCVAAYLTLYRQSYDTDVMQIYELFKKSLTKIGRRFEFEKELPFDDKDFKHSLHGDIEYLYTVNILGEGRNFKITIKYIHIPIGEHDELSQDNRKIVEKCLLEGTELDLKLIKI